MSDVWKNLSEKQRNLRNVRKSRKECIKCGNPSRPDRTTCSDCAEKQKLYQSPSFVPTRKWTRQLKSDVRTCPMCETEKFRTEFSGTHSYCRVCSVQYQKDWSKQHPGVAAKAQKLRYEKSWVKRAFQRMKARAKELNIPFSISQKDVVVPEFCPILGVRLVIRGGPCSPSVDRFMPHLGYVPGNVSVISYRANQIKNDASVSDLEKVINWMKERGA